MKRAFTNARLVCPTRGVLAGTLITEGDRIVSVAQTGLPRDAEGVECKGLPLAPAIVDLGVFANALPALPAGGIARDGLTRSAERRFGRECESSGGSWGV